MLLGITWVLERCEGVIQQKMWSVVHIVQATASAVPQKTNFPEVPEGKPLGIITIEDVIEELLQQVCSDVAYSRPG